MSFAVAAPQCFVEIWPFEGGPFFIQNQQLLSCRTHRNIREDYGTFEIVLPPGGAGGVNSSPTWTQIITPNSLVLIGMSRWKYAAIDMVGIVTSVTEHQAWRDGTVERVIVVSGQDFAYFFNSFNWCTLSFLGTTAAHVLGQALGVPEAGLPAILGGNLLQGTPDQVARGWFNQAPNGPMAGPGGVLAHTFVQYGSQQVSFPQAMATLFEPYPGFQIPYGTFFVTAEGSWTAKFREILPFPWYEFYVMTAPVLPNAPVSGPAATAALFSNATGGFPFSMKGLGPTIAASPVLVGRVNPLPRIPVTVANGAASFGAIDVSAWNALPLYEDYASFIESTVTFSQDEVRNFYALSPTWFRRMYGDSGSAISPFFFSFVGAADFPSIHRYGYRPEYAETAWISDLTGAAVASQTLDVEKIIGDLIGRLFSYYEPTPLMARATVKIVLRPDIFPGSRYRYAPFKNEPPFDFYIEGVTHSFVFGGESATTLTLARGLPSSIYADPSLNGILTRAHLGNATRFAGTYQTGLPPSLTSGLAPPFSQGLAAFGLSNASIDAVMGNMGQVWNSPQAR